MPADIDLIVGLGNPGPSYKHTRHNVGFWFLDELASRYHTALRNEAKFQGEIGRLTADSCWLLKPATYMNLSGRSVCAVSRYYGIALDRILVVHDDLDLPPGAVRFKQGGGHGGHKGLRDLMERFGAGGFLRLRIGIGHPGSRDAVTPYVLSGPPAIEQALIVDAIERALEAVPELLAGEFQTVMNRLHSRLNVVGSP